MKYLSQVFVLLLLFSCEQLQRRPASYSSSRDEKVQVIVDKLKREILDSKIYVAQNDEYFDLTAYLGTHYTSMYFLALGWTGELSQYSRIPAEHVKLLTSLQLPSGGWYRVLDQNLKEPGDLSATVLNYWFLKSQGADLKSPVMKNAARFIRANGGLDKTDVLTRFFMACFRNYSWDGLPSIPYLLFNDISPVGTDRFAAWIGPHILPIAILRNTKAQKIVSPLYKLDEFQTDPHSIKDFRQTLSGSDKSMIKKLIEFQKPQGSWGGYVIASIFGKMALGHSLSLDKKSESEVVGSSKLASRFLDKMLLYPEKNPLLGPIQDGHIWDTALLLGALAEADTEYREISGLVAHIKKFQQKNGGFPFGYGFESNPDVDDTAEIITAFSRVRQDKTLDASIKKAISFISSMQNKDGGFAAFSKDNKGNLLLDFFTKGLTDSADLYDESSADVTGHVLEALGRAGLNINNSKVVKNAVDYLRKVQEANGSFEGRWGINYVYGTSAAIVGLVSVGVPKNDPMIHIAVKWLIMKQNADGGFGESTLSYSKKEWHGVGKSTASQTAWGLIALQEVLSVDHPAVTASVDYLIETFEYEDTFVDQSVTGTGHPNVCYMVYPVYAKAFPLMALTRFLKH